MGSIQIETAENGYVVKVFEDGCKIYICKDIPTAIELLKDVLVTIH